VDAVKEQYYPVGNYDDQYMRWTTLHQERGQEVSEFTNTFHTLHTKLGIKYSERHLVLKYHGALHRYIQTEMDFWTSHHWELPIDMLSKSRRNLGTRTNGSSGLQIRNNQSMIKMTLTNNLPKTSPSHRKRRVMGKTKKDTGKWCDFHKIPGTTLMNVTQNNHWWPRSKTRSRTLIQNLIQKIMGEDRSSTQTPLLLSRPQQFNQKNQQILKRGSTFFIHRCG
jgi:hypothetical protein